MHNNAFQRGNTALKSAASRNCCETLKILLAHPSIDINLQNKVHLLVVFIYFVNNTATHDKETGIFFSKDARPSGLFCPRLI